MIQSKPNTLNTGPRTRSQRSYLWNEIKRNKVAYVYIAPFYILFIIFGLFPIVAGFFISFFNWDGVSAMKFIGIRNYVRLLTDSLFWKALYNTIYIGIFSHIFILFGGLVLAYILNSKLVKYPNIFKTIYFLPMITSAVAASIVFQALFGLNAGLINFMLQTVGFEKIDWWGGTGQYVKIAIIIMFSWKWVGWNMVIYLSGMQGISEDIYEAAIIDGASHTQIFFRITIPLLKPVILFTLIQSTIGTINLFTEPFVLTGLKGGTANQGLTVMMYLLDRAPYGNNLYGYASACAYVLCAIIMMVSLINMKSFGEKE
ncbi:MAG: sugar ABC transporter permease [Caldicoprobacterales bacterium]|nr:sugar ABC transporter permease [Clostridiales bacterium]